MSISNHSTVPVGEAPPSEIRRRRATRGFGVATLIVGLLATGLTAWLVIGMWLVWSFPPEGPPGPTEGVWVVGVMVYLFAAVVVWVITFLLGSAWGERRGDHLELRIFGAVWGIFAIAWTGQWFLGISRISDPRYKWYGVGDTFHVATAAVGVVFWVVALAFLWVAASPRLRDQTSA